jgi:hypothetical protein
VIRRSPVAFVASAVAVMAAALLVSACEPAPPSAGTAQLDAPFALVVNSAKEGSWRANGDDRIEVWVCHVPLDSTAKVYGGLQVRRTITPTGLAAVISPRVSAYFLTISNGRYRPSIVPGGEWQMSRTDLPQACADHAIAAAGPTTRAVLLVADAEHAADQPGGIGSAGLPCLGSGPCAVAQSRRWAYVGAADFAPRWGADPPMDLVEHELGHTLGWVHSGTPPATRVAGDYDSALDAMSDSAAPRHTDPARRDAPDTLAIDRVACGWLSADDAVVADQKKGAVSADLSPSTGASGTRLMVLPVDGSSFLTVELLTPTGYDDHLPMAGIAVHLVTVSGKQLDHVAPLFAKTPYTDLLQVGASAHWHMWRVSVADHWKVTATPVGA